MGQVIMWWKDYKLYDVQLVLTSGLTKTEVCLCLDRNDNCLLVDWRFYLAVTACSVSSRSVMLAVSRVTKSFGIKSSLIWFS